MEAEADILSYEGYFSMEMTNYNSYVGNQLEHGGIIYDKMLQAGKRVFCHGVDDNHNRHPVGDPSCDSFGGFTMILADELTYDSVFSAMEQGDMYSSMGPVFKEVSVNDGIVHVECTEVTCIHFFTGSKRPKFVYASDGGTLTCADMPLDPRAKYLRVSIRDAQGKWADTRGFFPDELQV